MREYTLNPPDRLPVFDSPSSTRGWVHSAFPIQPNSWKLSQIER